MPSIWSQTVTMPKFPALREDKKVHTAVIGGGLAGLLTAYLLKRRGIECIVLEAFRTGSGQTKNTTAKITSQHGLMYHKLIEEKGYEQAKLYAEINQHAIEQFGEIIRAESIACDYERRNAYLFGKGGGDALRAEADAAASLGIHAYHVGGTGLPFPTAGAVCFENQAQFHPLRFLKGISMGLNIYENSPVREVEGDTLILDECKVTASHIVFATHFPFVNMPGYYFARMYQSRSYSLALKNAPMPDGMYVGCGDDAISLRKYKEYTIMAALAHRTGENSQGGKYQALRTMAKQLFPKSEEAAAWSAQDCMTADNVPYIGKYAANRPGWYVATGFNKWGMTGSMAAAQVISELIATGSSRYEELFSPRRVDTAMMGEVVREGVQAVKGLMRRNLSVPREELDSLPSGHGGVVQTDEGKAGVYKDENGQVYIVDVRCPHMGCQVEWNPDEKSWDCPCHGSRFDYKGNLIDNPAQENLNRME